MATQMVVAHATKYTDSNFSSGALGRHIDRKHVPENAVPGLQDKNFEIVSQDKTLKESVEQRIKEGYKGERAIRKDAVKSVGIIFSGSHEQMKKIESAGLIEQWAKDTYDFAAERWGKENIVRATVHMDEKTPHMHLHFVPLTEDGRLSAKEIVSKQNLKDLQNNYAKKMQEYGLERGIDGSKQKHITTKQYYQKETEIKQTAEQILNHSNPREFVEYLLRENEELRRKEELKKLQTEGKKEQIKTNPDKGNNYEEHSRKIERESNKLSRAEGETKQINRGFKF